MCEFVHTSCSLHFDRPIDLNRYIPFILSNTGLCELVTCDLLTCFPKAILSPSDSWISAEAPLCLEMALFSPTSLFFINPEPVMWSAWQWVLTIRQKKSMFTPGFAKRSTVNCNFNQTQCLWWSEKLQHPEESYTARG